MNTIIQSINYVHSLYRESDYRSPILNKFNGNGLLENYIIAKLTNQNTVRLLLDQDQLQAESQAIADQITKKIEKNISDLFK